MNPVYNSAVNCANALLNLYGKCTGSNSRSKLSRFARGRNGIIRHITAEMDSLERKGITVWIHAASMGEYAVARPIIDELHRRCECTIVMTFFSPSGYETVSRRHPGIDRVFYLPIDTRHNAEAFLDAVKPDRAVFIISEIWPNYLQQLKFRGVPSYLVSAIIRPDSSYFKWYGKTFRKALSAFNKVFVLNDDSLINLKMLGSNRGELSGDPLFDNATLVAATPWHDPVIENFCHGRDVFVAGSVNDINDIALVTETANRTADIAGSIIVPHDITPDAIRLITKRLTGNVKLYSQCTADTAFNPGDVLIMDSMGQLAYLYRQATVAYVGGGFTPLLHSVIEPVVYGVPVIFGPNIKRKVTPHEMMDSGIGFMVSTPAGLHDKVVELLADKTRLSEIRDKAAEYVNHRTGSRSRVSEVIINAES
ncbi:MAG: 3-deoxy-D-manno-octulosonic acid transferase [Paramuribaculum sp.]|nr:3-deoxy-D-manno-octulosonic acid transferase [Paramuribaculum sp.]